MTLTKQKMRILEIMKKIGKETTPNELQLLYNQTHKKETIGVGLYKQLNRLMTDGYVKRVSDTHYALTDKLTKITGTEVKKKNTRFTPEEVEQFHTFAADPNFKERIAELLNPALLELHKERMACLLSLISTSDKEGDRNRIHVLLEGEPSTGKTAIIHYAEKYLWGLGCDADSTSTGLKGSGRGYQFSEGLLQKADNNSLYIDEIDKMGFEDQNALLSAMESGRVTINKASVHKDSDARVRVIATCNNKVKLREELKSRFDLKFTISRITDEDKKSIIIKRVNDWERSKGVFDSTFLKNYLIYAKEHQSKLPEDRDGIAQFVIDEMETGRLQGKDVRGTETIIRLSIAVAKLNLHPEVTEEDIKDAIDLMG